MRLLHKKRIAVFHTPNMNRAWHTLPRTVPIFCVFQWWVRKETLQKMVFIWFCPSVCHCAICSNSVIPKTVLSNLVFGVLLKFVTIFRFWLHDHQAVSLTKGP